MLAKLRLFTSPPAFPNPQRLRLFMHEKEFKISLMKSSMT